MQSLCTPIILLKGFTVSFVLNVTLLKLLALENNVCLMGEQNGVQLMQLL